jgi:RNA binding exosome subunit
MMHGLFMRAFVRSTEDPEKVKQAMKTINPFLDEKRLIIREHRGVYGNLFLSLSYEGKKKEALKVWNHIWENLDQEDREFLKERIEEFVDELGHLHLRFKKQEAYEGRLVLGTSGVIKVVFKLEAYPARSEKFREVARRLVEG